MSWRTVWWKNITIFARLMVWALARTLSFTLSRDLYKMISFMDFSYFLPVGSFSGFSWPLLKWAKRSWRIGYCRWRTYFCWCSRIRICGKDEKEFHYLQGPEKMTSTWSHFRCFKVSGQVWYLALMRKRRRSVSLGTYSSNRTEFSLHFGSISVSLFTNSVK